MPGNLDHLSISLPDQKNYEMAYGLAFKIASEKLSNIVNLEEQCRKSDSICQIDGLNRFITLKYLNHTYQVKLPEMNISLQHSNQPVELRDKLLILHHLTLAKGTPLSNLLIAYQELREGATYYPTFVKRAVRPLIEYFGQFPEKLLDVSVKLGSLKAAYGDVAVTIPAFSRVPITLILWRGDEEFPPNANILFDSTILDYLSAEDVNVLCQTITWYLVNSLEAH
jgi:hypothetical protein